jgi:hypothetical protein
MTDRNDARYLDSGNIRAILHAWINDADMGCWADDDEEAFREAVIDEMRHAAAGGPGFDYDGEDLVIERVDMDA